jgi:hypothetical protein
MLRSAAMHCSIPSSICGGKAHVFESPDSHEPHWEPGTYVATLTPETTHQHTGHREIPFLCRQFRATHTFDGDIVKLLLDRRLEYGVHFL